MQRYILRRIIRAIICLFVVSIIIFMLARVSGDPVSVMMPPEATKADREAFRQKLGLDRPLHVQYWDYISKAVRGDFGESFKWSRPVRDLIQERLPNSLQLAGLAMLMALVLGVSIGTLSSLRPGGLLDSFGKVFALLGQAAPVFWVGLMLMLVFAITLKWLPTSGMGGPKNLIMPSVALGWYATAAITRLTRSSMLDVLDSEYVKMARIKGLPERSVIFKHAFKNAAIPVVTMASLQFVIMLSGAVVTETIFRWPGVGKLMIEAVYSRDYPVAQGVILVSSAMFMVANLAVDILYGYLDPRIKYD